MGFDINATTKAVVVLAGFFFFFIEETPYTTHSFKIKAIAYAIHCMEGNILDLRSIAYPLFRK